MLSSRPVSGKQTSLGPLKDKVLEASMKKIDVYLR